MRSGLVDSGHAKTRLVVNASDYTRKILIPITLNPTCQVRVAAVRALRALVPCGAADALLTLTAFQDPHYVPVRAFYGPCVRVNFCARLAVDASVQARRAHVGAGSAQTAVLLVRN